MSYLTTELLTSLLQGGAAAMNFFAAKSKKVSMPSSKLNWQDFSATRSTVPPDGIQAIVATVHISAPS